MRTSTSSTLAATNRSTQRSLSPQFPVKVIWNREKKYARAQRSSRDTVVCIDRVVVDESASRSGVPGWTSLGQRHELTPAGR
ncbi:hypothetical protein E4U53_004119 [Claviceps sorghi]|nr:hypothetical protein E4U53_004119 [Claviceps sorghi]